MNRNRRSHSWRVVFLIVLISLFSTLSSTAQKSDRGTLPPLWEDTTKNPHDFTNRFYTDNGVNPKAIIGRRTGMDGLSVTSYTSNPYNSDVRVLITIPAYDQYGEIKFWYPLGELQYDGFTVNGKAGANAREMAKYFPLYVFPEPNVNTFNSFTNGRQAPLIDDSWVKNGSGDFGLNPLGLREIRIVHYTEKARGKEGFETMDYFGKKNGLATDGTPLIRSIDDIQYLQKLDMISVETMAGNNVKPFGGPYAFSPMIDDPTGGVIAKDAFLWMASKDSKWMPGEQMFVWQFGCLQMTGDWCQK